MLKLNYSNEMLEAGCDEAGRGCLAGPVVAAAVILPQSYQNSILNDSKQLTLKQRLALRLDIEDKAIAYAIGIVSHQEIDQINILNASILAMHKAIEKLKAEPKFLIIDGNRFKPYREIPHQCIVKGDSKYLSIAAASVLAKTYRDELMENLSQEYPMYYWQRNRGYPTKQHRQAIVEHGVSPHHRLSFKLTKTE